MKKIIIIFVTLLSLSAYKVFADQHLYVEGLKVGDSLLDSYSKDDLNQVEDWLSFSPSYHLFDLTTISERWYFPELFAAVNKNDPNYIIQGLQGIRVVEVINECEKELSLYDDFWQKNMNNYKREEIRKRAVRFGKNADLHILQFVTDEMVYSFSCWKLDERFNGIYEGIMMLNIESLDYSEYYGAKTYLM